MKIQLITQNIKHTVLNTQTNSNPILKNIPADSFEKQSNVAFKGAAAEVATSVVDEAFKSKVLASIATKGEKGVGELFTDLTTARNTLTVLRDLLEISTNSFWAITNGKKSFPTQEETISALVKHHNDFRDACSFWKKLSDEESPLQPFLQTMYKTAEDLDNLILPIYDHVDDLASLGVIMPNNLQEFMSIETWVQQYL